MTEVPKSKDQALIGMIMVTKISVQRKEAVIQVTAIGMGIE